VLLMYGSETRPMFVRLREAPRAVLPHSTVLRLPGLNHDSAQTHGKPETIAVALRLFLGNELNDLPRPAYRSSLRVVADVGYATQVGLKGHESQMASSKPNAGIQE
jgi:hypothetical protein